MNPIHLRYIRGTPYNKFAYLFSVIDNLDPKRRDAAMMNTFWQFVKMAREPDAGPHERLGDTLTDYANYNRFKEECRKLPSNLDQAFMVNGIVVFTLSYCFNRADADREKVLVANGKILGRAQSALQNATNDLDRQSAKKMIAMIEGKIRNFDSELKDDQELYAYICENLAKPLLEKWEAEAKSFMG